MGFDVRIDAFSGPFELLFHLIEVNKMDIYDIPISELTAQYIAFIGAADYGHDNRPAGEQSERRGMDGMSAFLVMAAQLLMIKSAMLLPGAEKDGEEPEDPRGKLTQMLLLYKAFKDIALELREKEQKARFFLFREQSGAPELPARDTDIGELLDGVTLQGLTEVYNDIVKRRDLSVDPIRSNFGTVPLDMYSVGAKAKELRAHFALCGKTRFYEIIGRARCKEEAVVIFLAVLELIKSSLIAVRQSANFSDFSIEWRQGVEPVRD